MTGSAVQAVNTIRFTVIWNFNHDSAYHFIMLLFLFVQWKGIRRLAD